MKATYQIKKLLGMARTWIIDNGHGKLTSGKRSPVLPDGRQFFEYEFNRDVAVRLMALLKAEGIPYVDLVPDYDHLGNFVMGRIGRANALPGATNMVYLSIHSDAAPSDLADEEGWSQPHGATVFYESNDGMRMAKEFSESLSALFRNRGIKRSLNKDGKQFYAVLRETRMPALLLELGFYTNKEEVQRLLDGDFRQQIAVTLFETIKRIENV
jgi:N-acetylmuramoyl-L-alanine amidase